MMEKGCDILLFGTMGNTGPAVRDSLAGHGFSVRLVDFAQNTLRDEPGYRRELLKTLACFQPRMVIPIGNQTAMARLKLGLPSDILIPVSDAAVVELLDSKVRCSRMVAGLGVLQPRMFSSASEVGTFPVIFKRDRSFGGSGVMRPRSREALQRLMEHEPQNPFLIEELIEGQDYSVDAVRWDGFFRASCYRSLANRGQGPSTQREAVIREDLCVIARQILDHVDYRGVCGMDFRINSDGKAYFLECNPRFTGGIETQIAAGFDIPYVLVSCCIGLNGLQR